ncbi:hypothetical protein [Parasulfitobacter algicola]|uniref:Glycerophosphoryl diester phosphodiesterase membrane domain-containing protein n=1 Tax=Parasulfitobacter algicola TaxID=2614809 RepID=A0ABX2IK88_9RHOB|nr:hypothetical protein [Sulfitobacter algicola]NSX53297.1 hypothetical protein [Sulfitobacter algicola]
MEKEPLKLGSILDTSGRIFFSNMHWLFLFSFVPAIVIILAPILTRFITFHILTLDYFLSTSGTANPSTISWITGVFTFIRLFVINVLASSIAAGCIACLVRGILKSEPVRPLCYFAKTFRLIVPLFFVCFITNLVTIIGLLVIIPGLIFAVWFFVLIPTLMIEDNRYFSPSRSKALAAGYGWPILCLVVLKGVFAVICTFLPTFFFPLDITWIGWIMSAVISMTSMVFFSIASAITYFRLIEIKEGYSTQNIAEIFS